MPRRRYDDEDDDDFDDRPRRRTRRTYADDDYARPRPRARRNRRANSKAIITAGIVIGVCIVVAISAVMIAQTRSNGNGRGLFSRSSDISFAKFKEINSASTVAELEKRFGKADKLGPDEWDKIVLSSIDGQRPAGGTTLADIMRGQARSIDVVYRWQKGPEEIFVADGVTVEGRRGLVLKVYRNPKAPEWNMREQDRSKWVQWFVYEGLI